MGNSSSMVIAAASVAATATAAWVLCSSFSSETMDSQNRSSATKDSQNKSSETKKLQSRSLETMEDLDFPHVDVNIGDSPIYDPETEAGLFVMDNLVRFQSKEEVHDQNSLRSKAKQKLKADANKKNSKHFIPNSYNYVVNSEGHNKIQSYKSYEDTGAEADSSQVGGKIVTPISLRKHRRQKSKYSENQKPQKLKWKRKLKDDGDDQILKHLTPRIHLQETVKIMSYNIWSIKYYKKEKRMNAVNHLIEQHSPDIVLLQEVTPEVYIYFQSCNWWDVYKCSVKEKLVTKQVFFCMMLSKLPVKKFFHKHFVNTKTCKGVSAAKCTSNPKKALTVATCHLKSPRGAYTYDAVRRSQAKEAIDILKSSPNVVLGGDMNWDESTDGPFPLTSGWCDAWSDLKPEEDGYTYDTVSNAMLRGRRKVVQKRLDRFVCRLEDFDMIDIEIVGTEAIKGVSRKSNGGKKLPLLPSDHYGLILTICAK